MIGLTKVQDSDLFGIQQKSNITSSKPFPVAITDPYAKETLKHHRLGHHLNQFDKDAPFNIALKNDIDMHPKRQHFVAGKPLCGSASNGLVYGSSPATAPSFSKGGHWKSNGVDRNERETQNGGRGSLGFLYGNEDTRVGKPKHVKQGLPPWMRDKTSADIKKRDIQAKEIEQDIARTRLMKANQQTKRFEEQKKDLEMLQNYKPWGKPGGGAPRGMENDQMSTVRTRRVDSLSNDKNQLLPLGKPGGGAPIRTESGKILTKMHGDAQIRGRAHRDGRPIDSLPMQNADRAYKTELDRLAEETRARRFREKEQDFYSEIETLKYHPFGRPGAGAPLKDQDGSPRTGLPQQLSNNIYEMRSKDTRHGHPLPGNDENHEQQPPRRDFARTKPVDAGKGYDENDQGFHFGMPGGGAPMRNKDGKVVSYSRRTLVKDNGGALVKSATRTRGDEYYPFGKPGAGAPIRDDKGNVTTSIAGRIDNAKLGKFEGNMENREGKREYLNTLKSMQEEKEHRKQRERSDMLEPAPEVTSWIKRGMVGQPKYDPYTHEIRADPHITSDVTKQRMNIQQQGTTRSRDYHNELDEIQRQRQQQRKKEAEEQRQKSVEHVRTMDSVWGKPGNGAPMSHTKRAKVEMNPADYGMKYRDK